MVRLLLFLAIAYSATLLGLSLGNISKLPLPDIDNVDKAYHAIAYFGLVLLWFLYFFMRKANDMFRIKSLVFVSLCALLFGIFIELLQRTITTNRTWDYFDMLANLTGISIAFLLLTVLKGRLEKTKMKH